MTLTSFDKLKHVFSELQKRVSPTMLTAQDQAKRSLLGPAISLILVSSLGLILSLYGFWNSLILYFQTPGLTKDASELVDQFGSLVAENEKDLEKQEAVRKTMGGFQSAIQSLGSFSQPFAGSSAVYLGIMSVLNMVILAGGISMMSLKRYGLAITAAIIALIPTVGPCCILSVPFGIWAIIVLSNAQTRVAFYTHA